MTSDRSRLLWDRSVPLVEYATKAIIADALAAPLIATRLRWQIPEIMLRLGSRAPFSDDPVFRRILSDARRGKFTVTGFRRAPTHSPGPVQIPRSMLVHASFRLMQNRIEGDGFAYEDVRIIAYRELPKSLRWRKPNQQMRQAQIKSVIKRLNKSGILSGKLLKVQTGIVRDALEKMGVKNIGTDKTLERVIRQITGPIKSK